MRIRMDAAVLVASIVPLFCGLIFPQHPALAETNTPSTNAQPPQTNHPALARTHIRSTRQTSRRALARTNTPSTGAQVPQTIVARADVCTWNDVGWGDMSEEERKEWETLGWTWQMWDAEEQGPQPPSSSKGWVELNENERVAAQRLGYKRNTWDADNCQKH